MLAALAGFLALQVVAFVHAGVFEYPLDDVYIHLAMASNIARGTYGVNAGEAASAASSILYPFLLVPFPDSEFQRLLPLFWNTLAVAGCGWVWGRIVADAGLTGFAAAVLAVAGPVLLNISGVGYTGMEAAPHMLASLMIVFGLWRALTGRGVSAWFIAAAIAAPLLRYEGLALALGAAGALLLTGERRAGLAIVSGALGGVVAFSLFLVSQGLEPLPGSVLAKTSSLDPNGNSALRYVVGFLANLTRPAAMVIAALAVVAVLATLALPALRRGPAFWLLMVVVLSALGHLVFGQIGWMHRYEPYILISLAAALLLVSASVEKAGILLRGAVVLAIVGAGVSYMPSLWGTYVWNPRAIHLQQAQMARLAQDYLDVPVAVNDLGQVAWGNRNYVLDLWGLGSDEARKIRFGHEQPGPRWAGPLAGKHGIKAAMIYDDWFATAAGEDWVRVATMVTLEPKGTLGGWEVAIYATDPSYARELRDKLAEFAPTLPEGAAVLLEPET
ncbi:MAG: hypothetical protein B7Z02_01690 [Rhodobacterales bacterium 32-67-9]|nr:MAG: hypothetical protein B7Z02_01690 [Rhodobacterales bacterium 32-67-9]